MIETIRAAFVIARRDFTAIIFSKSFFFFLLGPIFPLAIGIAAGGLGQQVNRDIDRPVFGVALAPDEADSLIAARAALSKSLGSRSFPELRILPDANPDDPDIRRYLNAAEQPLTAILSGSLAAPRLTGSKNDINQWTGKTALLAETALTGSQPVSVSTDPVADTESAKKRTQLATAQGGQAILILLTMILAGMVLSNLVEEKTNKIIEILAAAIPMDAIFLGK